MPEYLVKSRLAHGGNEYVEGQTIELDAEVAAKIPDAVELLPSLGEDETLIVELKPTKAAKSGGEAK